MIHILCAEEKLRYQAYHLVRAFWPEEETDIRTEPGKPCIRLFLNDHGGAFVQAEDIRDLYEKLRSAAGADLPWGMLTGVRPTKLATQWIAAHPEQEGKERRAAFIRWFYDERYVSAEKAGLAYDIAVTEQALTGFPGQSLKGASLYAGIPFCPSVCRYCSFSSGPIDRYRDRVSLYLDALVQEMKRRKMEYFPDGSWPLTVYFGGGTPTALDAAALQRLLAAAEEVFAIRRGIREGRIREYTVEAGRPDSITKEKLRILKDAGVSRISVNPQTMNQKTLDRIGRNHTVEQTEEAYALAREAGFDNINMDLILGLPGERVEDVRNTLRKIRQMKPDSLTVHTLAVKRSSDMGIRQRLGQKEQDAYASPQQIAAMIEEARRSALWMGMHPYYLYRQKQIAGNFENIGYSVPGKEGLYNILIMEELQSILACGAGATTKLVAEEEKTAASERGRRARIIRTANAKNIEEYLRRNPVV